MQPATLFLYFFLISTNMPVNARVPTAWPSNIWVQPELRETMTALWQTSPTFRAQCDRIGAQRRYHVHIVIDASMVLHRRCRAQCTMRSFTTGLVMARIAVPDKQELHELIPHELEHVIEHIDGVDLRRLMVQGGTGVYEVGDGRIETARAISAGRKVRAEMATGQLVTRR
jgi:hypothetical protein